MVTIMHVDLAPADDKTARLCGPGFAYCDGKCAECTDRETIADNKTRPSQENLRRDCLHE